MCRQVPLLATLVAITAALMGCHPQQPFYFKHVDDDLSHYKGVATDIEYPDVEADRLADVADSQRPFSLTNNAKKEIWDLTLQEAMELALRNNKVMRNIGGQVQGPPDFILRNPEFAPTIWDPALAETDPRTSAEAALSVFDAQFTSSLLWERTDTPRNVNAAFSNFFATVSEHDLATFQSKLAKVTATGGQFSIAHNVAYDRDRFPYVDPITGVQLSPLAWPTSWNVNLVAEWRQPLLQGAGVQFNRIAGPGAQPGVYGGVVIARLNTDKALVNFEASVRNLVSDVETAYWELYFQYRSLDAVIAGRDSALQTWRKVYTQYRFGGQGGEANREAQAREQYFLFRSTLEQSLNALYVTEGKLRYLMGLAPTDGRLIRPKDEPTTAKVVFDWCDVLNEGLVRSVELRGQKFSVKERELELIAAKNFLLPKLDFVSQYRWLGLGNRLDGNTALTPDDLQQVPAPDANAYGTLADGNFQEWQMGLQLNVPLGFRREMADVRNRQLALARERAKLQEGELELTHQMAFAVRDMEANHVLSETNFNRRNAALREVEAVAAAYDNGTVTIDVLLQAQQNLARAESDYYRSIVDYNKAISQIHYRKGSLLEYNGVYLAEGPWPAKAYFDAQRRARARAASTHLDYGFTQPRVMSRGPVDQMPGGSTGHSETEKSDSKQELVPTPDPEASKSSTQAEPISEPQASKGSRSGGWVAATFKAAEGSGLASSGNRRDTSVVPTSWTTAAEGSSDESRTHSTTVTTDQSTAGWKGVQH